MITAIVTLLGGWRATAFAALAVVLLGWLGIDHARLGHAKAEIAAMKAQAAIDNAAALTAAQEAGAKARAIEQFNQAAIIKAANDYQRGKTDAEGIANRVAAGLRAGTVRLRNDLAACQGRAVPETASDPGRADGSADVRSAIEGAVAGTAAVGHSCDARVTALQDILKAERQSQPKE